MKKLTLKELQDKEIQMLKKTRDFFDKNQITYILSYGTLLGAVRHGGFIPWDDDIDLLVPRASYEKLKKIVKDKSYINDFEFEFQSPGDRGYSLPFIKVVNKQIIVKDKVASEKYRKYLWIDVFPLDYVSDDKCRQLELYRRVNWLQKVLETDSKKRTTRWTLRRIVGVIINRIYGGSTRICKKIDKLCAESNYNNENSNFLGCAVFPEQFNSFFPKKLIYPLNKIMFEGEFYSIPKEYHEHLKYYYGDYWVLPPEDQRIRHYIEAYCVRD